jgi:hypothetical protein
MLCESGCWKAELLHERVENCFPYPLVRIWFYRGRKSNTSNLNIRSIPGAIEEDGVMVRLQVISKQCLYRGQTSSKPGALSFQ